MRIVRRLKSQAHALLRNQSPFRIFCIGFNKTGTTSLHRFFGRQRLVSIHGTNWPHASWLPKGRRYFKRADCYSDGEGANFAALEAWFPEALFILNTRDEKAWLRSRVKHVFRNDSDAAQGQAHQELMTMAQEFLEGPELAIDGWIAARRLYEARVHRHFAGSARFLELRVTEDFDWAQQLADMLARHNRLAAPDAVAEPIHSNKRSAFTLFPQIETSLALIDDRLERAGSASDMRPAYAI